MWSFYAWNPRAIEEAVYFFWCMYFVEYFVDFDPRKQK